MKSLFQILVFIGLFTYQLMAQVNYTSKEGQFTCSFPCNPTEEVSDLEGGTKFYQLQCMKGEDIYMMFFANYSDKTDKAKAKLATIAAKDAFVDKLQAKVKSEESYEYMGYTGYELQLETAERFKVYYRVIHISQSLYQFAVVGAAPKKNDVNNFFSSFKYTGSK
ncbi:MAG: hypothetical protein KatS3mg035_0519 [Bacteroidia bacterium]|nr:MAG: hypothetical protein KatS3mg035_0519 [Bacteroidia bacterium]